jgi:[ribosomal protein S18]-alanine N-acetyltransferase
VLPIHPFSLTDSMIPAVLAIEEAAFAGDSWNATDFKHMKSRRDGIVTLFESRASESDRPVVGFIAYTLATGYIRIWNFAIHPMYQRRGVGTWAIRDYMASKLHAHRRVKILLDLRESALEAQLFFRAMGYKAINVKRHYYDDTDESAYEMQYRLPGGIDCHVEDEPEHVAQEEG